MDGSFGRSHSFRGRNISASGWVAFHGPMTIGRGVSSSRETLHAHRETHFPRSTLLERSGQPVGTSSSEPFGFFAPLMCVVLSVSCTTVPPNLDSDSGRHG